ncbi:hypothetical protein ACH347_02235 [Saccharopolyspora sp. 5N102]|uniref:hypothetical protein n=1 Tax=Saccharopolyspora sp. 5N102 TaxID=3375155 RepID=UPI0037BA4F6D
MAPAANSPYPAALTARNTGRRHHGWCGTNGRTRVDDLGCGGPAPAPEPQRRHGERSCGRRPPQRCRARRAEVLVEFFLILQGFRRQLAGLYAGGGESAVLGVVGGGGDRRATGGQRVVALEPRVALEDFRASDLVAAGVAVPCCGECGGPVRGVVEAIAGLQVQARGDRHVQGDVGRVTTASAVTGQAARKPKDASAHLLI